MTTRRARRKIRKAIQAIRAGNAEVARIHPELATPKILAAIQKAAIMAGKSHIATLKVQARILRRYDRLQRRRPHERPNDP